MRLQRILTALTICALALLAATVPATAAPAATASGAVWSARDLPRRAMNEDVFTNSKGWLIFKGNVDPGWNHRNVQIYKKLCKACDFSLVKKVRTDGQGRWRTRIYAPPTDYWYWKGVVPKAGGYGRSVTQIWRSYVD